MTNEPDEGGRQRPVTTFGLKKAIIVAALGVAIAVAVALANL